jgi:hypothetical protein
MRCARTSPVPCGSPKQSLPIASQNTTEEVFPIGSSKGVRDFREFQERWWTDHQMSEDDVFVQCHDGLVRLPLKAARACGLLCEFIPQASDERAVIPIPDVKYEDLKELMAFEPPSDWVSAGEQVSRLGKLADFLLFEKFLRYCANAIWSVPISRTWS